MNLLRIAVTELVHSELATEYLLRNWSVVNLLRIAITELVRSEFATEYPLWNYSVVKVLRNCYGLRRTYFAMDLLRK